MSTEHGSGERLSKKGTRTQPLGKTHPSQSGEQATQSKPSSQQEESQSHSVTPAQNQSNLDQSRPSGEAISSIESDAHPASTARGGHVEEPSRQVIAVSASKGPAAFFNLARKFLATDEMCDLSALEGAIVSAVDAAHLLERSQLATIVRVNTSYVTVEPKRRKQQTKEQDEDSTHGQSHAAEQVMESGGEKSGPVSSLSQAIESKPSAQPSATPDPSAASQVGANAARQARSSGRELRRARIVITVRRTESYKRWLEENPLQSIIAIEGDADAALQSATGLSSKLPEG